VRIDGGVLVLRMQSSARQGQRDVGDPIDHGKWQLNGQGVVCDVVCCGVDSQAEGSDFFGATYYKLLGGGSQPTLSLYAACDERTATTTSEIVSKVCILCVRKKKIKYLKKKSNIHTCPPTGIYVCSNQLAAVAFDLAKSFLWSNKGAQSSRCSQNLLY
jgi:hypothetical protein